MLFLPFHPYIIPPISNIHPSKSHLSELLCIYTTTAFNLQLSSLTEIQPLPCLLSICKTLYTVL